MIGTRPCVGLGTARLAAAVLVLLLLSAEGSIVSLVAMSAAELAQTLVHHVALLQAVEAEPLLLDYVSTSLGGFFQERFAPERLVVLCLAKSAVFLRHVICRLQPSWRHTRAASGGLVGLFGHRLECTTALLQEFSQNPVLRHFGALDLQFPFAPAVRIQLLGHLECERFITQMNALNKW